MPRGANRRKRATAPDTETDNTPTEGNDDMTTGFDFTVEAAPEDYAPARSNPGRPRTPSPFDDVVAERLNAGYNFVSYSDEDQKQVITRELHKAKAFHDVGLDIYDNAAESRIEWRSRDKQKRAPRGSKSAAVAAEANPADGGDNDE